MDERTPAALVRHMASVLGYSLLLTALLR